jgi:RecA/RadA recombinase
VATLGALALAPAPDTARTPDATQAPATAQPIVRSGFRAIDGLIGGLPTQGTVSLVGDPSSGATTLALRSLAEAQAAGAIGAWLDLPGRFDPLEAAARGVDLRWLVVVRPLAVSDGLRIAGSLLGSRSVDLLVLDLPPRLPSAQAAVLRQLAAHARRVGARVLAIGSDGLAPALRDALAEASHLRLALAHRDWLRVGREVVGQRVTVTVEKDRGGAPGRAVDIEIMYPPDGERGPAVTRLLVEDTGPPGEAAGQSSRAPTLLRPLPIETPQRPTPHAPPPSPLGPSAAPAGAPPRARPGRPRRAGRTAVGPGQRP